MKNNLILQWFCKEVFDNWSESIDVKQLYNKAKQNYPDMPQDQIINYMSLAMKIISFNKEYNYY